MIVRIGIISRFGTSRSIHLAIADSTYLVVPQPSPLPLRLAILRDEAARAAVKSTYPLLLLFILLTMPITFDSHQPAGPHSWMDLLRVCLRHRGAAVRRVPRWSM